LLNIIAGISLVAMTALTCADVTFRLFRHPILGTYEIVGFLGASVAAFAMAYTTMKRGHVAVEVLVIQLPKRVRFTIYLVTKLLSLAVFALLCFECIRYGNDLKVSGEVSLTLELPFFPVLFGIAFSSFAVCLVLWMDFWMVITGKKKPWHRWE